MQRGYFTPVTIDLPSDRIGLYRNVTSAAEAAELLVGQWPLDGAVKRVKAMEACLDVLDKKRPANDAREAFIEAAKAANVYVRG